MGQLVIVKDGIVQRLHPLSRANVTVGRLDQNELVLEHPSVSRAHTRLSCDGAGWFVEDLGSTNGTLLNDRPVTERAPLRWGDRVRVGEFTLHFLPDEGGDSGGLLKTLEGLVELSGQFLDVVEPGELLERLLDRLMALFQAERGFVLLAGAGGALVPALSRCIDPAADDAGISMTVARDVAQKGKPLLLTDALAELRFRGVESIERSQVRSIVCAAMPGTPTPRGVVYLDSRAAARTYTPADLRILDLVTDLASRAVQQAERRSRQARHEQLYRALQDEGTRREHDCDNVVGASPAMQEILARVDDLAGGDITTIVMGESGTGKELVARAIHGRSARRAEPFVAVNCMALGPEVIVSELFGHEKGAFTGATARRLGRCELADGGTLFLDELGDLSMEVQVKLLRFLQEKAFERVGGATTVHVDVRVIAATNADLKARVAEGTFREDLYYRLNAFELRLPPLRERAEDVPLLADHYGRLFAAKMGRPFRGFDDEARRLMAAYGWPGNVRELRNVVERALVLERSGPVTAASLPFGSGAQAAAPASAATPPSAGLDLEGLPRDFHQAKELFERTMIARSLERNRWHIAKTARELGLPRKTIYRKIEAYGLTRADGS